MSEGLELAREYHRNLPPHLREHLQQARGISPEIIDLHVLGWNGSRVTIRICDRAGQAGLGAEGPDRRSENTGHARSPRRALWGGERVLANPEHIIIYEGEFDRWCSKVMASRR